MTATTSPLPKGTRVRVHSGLLTAPLECHVIAIVKPLPPKQRAHPNASTTRETTTHEPATPPEPLYALGHIHPRPWPFPPRITRLHHLASRDLLEVLELPPTRSR